MLFYRQLRDRLCTPEPPRIPSPGLHAACSWRTERGGLPETSSTVAPGSSWALTRTYQALFRLAVLPYHLGQLNHAREPTGSNIRSLDTPETTGWLYTHIVQPNSMIFSMTTRELTCIYQEECVVRSRGPSAPLAAAQHMDACDCNGATVARWRLPTERYRPIPIYAQWLFSEKHRPHTDTICAMCARHLVRPVLGDPIRQWSRDDCGPVNMAMMRRPEEANTTRLTPTGPMGLACCRLPGAT